VTYPRQDVQQCLGHFELVRVSLADRQPETRSLIKGYRTLWSPGFVLLDHNETELRRFLGFQQGTDFVAELRVGLGKVHLLHRRAEQAYIEWRAVADLDPPAPVSAEALYWSGIALFQQEKKPVDWLREYWSELGERFPDSRWWTAADVWEVGR
jgi:hypothetical protein